MSESKRDDYKHKVDIDRGHVVVRYRHLKRSASAAASDMLYYDFSLNGKRYRGCTDTPDIKLARIVGEKAVADAIKDAQRESEGPGITIAAAVLQYLDLNPDSAGRWRGKDKKGNRSYQDAKSRLAAFQEHCGDGLQLATMDADTMTSLLQKYIEKRTSKGIAGRTLVNDRLIMHWFFKWLVRNRRVQWRHNPAATISLDMPTLEEKEPTPLSQEHLDKLLPAVKKTDLWPVVVLCLSCAARPAEACRVTWFDVNLDKGSVRLLNKKGKKKRERIPELNTWAVAELTEWRESHKKDSQLFPRNYFSAFDIMFDVRTALGLPDTVTLQALRQTACTRLIEGGMQLKDYVLFTGHSLAVAERHYLKYGEKSREARRSVANSALDFTAPGSETTVKHSVKQAGA